MLTIVSLRQVVQLILTSTILFDRNRDRKEPIRVLAAKTLLIVLSEESADDKWIALSNYCADHNGCVSPKRLAALLSHVIALPAYFKINCDQIQQDIDSCFEKVIYKMKSHTIFYWSLFY